MAACDQSAQVMLVQGTAWYSRVIQRATKSPYSHCEIRVGERCYSADTGGVQMRKFSAYPWPHDLYNIVGMTPEKALCLESWCRSQLGRGYDYGKVLGIGLDLLLHKTGFRPILDSRRAFTCSEFVWEGLDRIYLKLDHPKATIVPGDLAHETWLEPAGEPCLLKRAVG